VLFVKDVNVGVVEACTMTTGRPNDFFILVVAFVGYDKWIGNGHTKKCLLRCFVTLPAEHVAKRPAMLAPVPPVVYLNTTNSKQDISVSRLAWSTMLLSFCSGS
jgi:hypothetical protein